MTKSNNKIEYREARTLRVHPQAQRDGLVKAKLNKIIDNLDLDAIGTLHVVEYPINGEDAAWVIDGQHRLVALLQRGMGEWRVRCEIHTDVKDDARASDLFLKLNDRSMPKPYETFRNEVQAQRASAVNITALAAKHGYTINDYGAESSLACPSALKRVYEIDEGRSLDLVLATSVAAWGHLQAGNEGKLIEGMGLVFAKNNGAIDKPAMSQKLAKYPGGPAALIGHAKGLKAVRNVSMARAVAEMVIETYNKGRTTGRIELP